MKSLIEEKYKSLFQFDPYDYQIAVAQKLLEGKNIILSVPTGAGKTWASIVPFLLARDNYDLHFPKKMIYNLPLRTLTNSIHGDVRKITDASIQTGEYSDDKYFERDIIFTTIDQTLSNFLCFPLALSKTQANIGAGAIIGSYLVFDEFHLLDPALSMRTTLGMLKMLDNLCRFCIMTATLSREFIATLKHKLPNCEIISLSDFPADSNIIASMLPKQNKKKLYILDRTISVENIALKHKTKTIVICNRVETAQRLYNDLMEDFDKYETLKNINKDNIICLHSRFFGADRKEKEQRLKELFGKHADKNEGAILISTQVIEAGMDISCEVLHTEISPINSFLQRAGRCARFENEIGEIYVYTVGEMTENEKINVESSDEIEKAEIKKINSRYLPYDKELCEKTYDELKKIESLDNDVPEKLIQKILVEREKLITDNFIQEHYNYSKILRSWNECKKSNYRNTIRDIQNVNIILMDDSKGADISGDLYAYQNISMYKWSFVGWLNKIQKSDEFKPDDFNDEWLVKQVVEDNIIENIEDAGVKLEPVTNYKDLPNLVVANSKYFGYSEKFGLNYKYHDSFGEVSPFQNSIKKEQESIIFKKDSFYEHNKALIGAFEEEFLHTKQLNFAFCELPHFIKKVDLQKADFIKLIKLMIVLHDYGKLNNKWQQPMQEYQNKKDPQYKINSEVLAHSDYDNNVQDDIELSRKSGMKNKPPHAGVGAYIAQQILPDFYDNWYIINGISIAIARHHSPLTLKYPDFEIGQNYYKAIQELLKELDIDIELDKKNYSGEIDGFKYGGWEREQLVYLFFVRILRLSDQKATENFEKYYKEVNHV